MYYLVFAFFYLVSLLPFWVLYRLSDFAYFVIYHLVGYRKAVVKDNLQQAFPEKSEDEIERIMRKFYLAFCDQWIEMIKLLSISKQSLGRRMQGNWEVLQELAKDGRNTYLLCGHTFNWEWVGAAARAKTPQEFGGIYLPLSSALFERLIFKIRTRSGAIPISLKSLKSGLALLKDTQYILGLVADQSPLMIEVAEWIPFMNREAPFFRGPEQMPRRAKAAVVLAGIKKLNRGYYQVVFEKLTDDASQLEAGIILKNYVSFLEQKLREQPENYLWTHRRWKHTRNASST